MPSCLVDELNCLNWLPEPLELADHLRILLKPDVFERVRERCVEECIQQAGLQNVERFEQFSS